MQLMTTTSAIDPISQTNRAPSTSEKYQIIQTDKVIEVFRSNGLEVIGTSVSRPRDPARVGFQKHLVAFSGPQFRRGEEQLQLLLTNAHDGSCAFRLDLGVFRFACANGLIDGDLESTVAVRHSKNALFHLDNAIQYQLDRLPALAAQIDELKGYYLSNEQTVELLTAAANARLGEEGWEAVKLPIVRRNEDQSRDLWTVFNRIQEGCIRGRMPYLQDGRWKHTRAITSIASITKLNKQLWNAALEIKEAV